MTATRLQIEQWLAEAKKIKATHMIVITDTFDYENYPHYIDPGCCVHTALVKLSSMQRAEEVYNLNKPLDEQLNRARCWEV